MSKTTELSLIAWNCASSFFIYIPKNSMLIVIIHSLQKQSEKSAFWKNRYLLLPLIWFINWFFYIATVKSSQSQYFSDYTVDDEKKIHLIDSLASTRETNYMNMLLQPHARCRKQIMEQINGLMEYWSLGVSYTRQEALTLT